MSFRLISLSTIAVICHALAVLTKTPVLSDIGDWFVWGSFSFSVLIVAAVICCGSIVMTTCGALGKEPEVFKKGIGLECLTRLSFWFYLSKVIALLFLGSQYWAVLLLSLAIRFTLMFNDTYKVPEDRDNDQQGI